MKKRIKIQYSIITLLLIGLSCKGQQSTNDKIIELKKVIASDKYPNIDGIVVAKDDKIIIEEYFNGFEKDSLHDTRSSFKSVTSLLAGIAIDKGLFKVEDEIQQFISEWKNDPRGKITVKNLLEMKSGLACEGFFGIGPDCESEMWETKNWLKYILNIPLRHNAGLNWAYTSMEPELVGIIISRTSGMTLMEFAKTHLFKPLGIENYKWYITPNGGGYAAGSFNMKPIDMLKIAQLVLNKGNWGGQQIVSEKWIDESTNCKIDVEMSFVRFAKIQNAKYTTANYGYLWYRELLQYNDIKTEALFASGNGGQYMMILDDYNTVIAFTGSNYGNWRGKLPFEIVLKYLIPILKEKK
ncbi:serine hydrolase [Aquimarina sp. 2201CG5-10]|uniref:serine hydrolase domain-containing protein n=1 Tax=Aquimarina callyspongiae TaxID=3098150 RepID=UPI002AB4F13E|nr:serine hydrolase [Aquimarina sp. 2201CG5-10]MDY8137451.1 serine hydrolase [Aquimarina sp. 2201CG5-10]